MLQPSTQQRLLALNRTFYTTVAEAFDETRSGLPAGWQILKAYLPVQTEENPIVVLDAGCGNGRFARALETFGVNYRYVGVDGNADLLARAAQHSAEWGAREITFLQADLAEPDWSAGLRRVPVQAEDENRAKFDLVVCFATLHHLPGYALRLQVVQELATLLRPNGVLMLSTWQFLTSERLAQKQIAWSAVNLTAGDVEPGDALLPWQQGEFAIRYVHQIDEDGVRQLAQDAGLTVVHSFYADGKEGNLNLYAVLRDG